MSSKEPLRSLKGYFIPKIHLLCCVVCCVLCLGCETRIFIFFEVSVFVVLIAASDAARREDAGSRLEIAVGILKVGFVSDLHFHKNFGPNVVFETLDCASKSRLFRSNI